jgi:hypothetical protein
LNITYLTEVEITAAFTLELFTTDGASDVLGAPDLVDEEAFLIGEVHITALAVLMFWESRLVLLHLPVGLEGEVAPAEGTGHTGGSRS